MARQMKDHFTPEISERDEKVKREERDQGVFKPDFLSSRIFSRVSW
jgi:hypothetical protein